VPNLLDIYFKNSVDITGDPEVGQGQCSEKAEYPLEEEEEEEDDDDEL